MITVSAIVSYLNSLMKRDAEVVVALLLKKVNCSENLLDHPTLQVTDDLQTSGLALLNGFFGLQADGFGLIQAVFRDGQLSHFEVRE